jgi:hypothetical protein
MSSATGRVVNSEAIRREIGRLDYSTMVSIPRRRIDRHQRASAYPREKASLERGGDLTAAA